LFAINARRYGFDARTNTAWAVIDYNGQFAITRFEK
jgi:hypothetical protein